LFVKERRDTLGTGWKFPIQVNARGGLSWSSAEEKVRESVWLVLKTGRGERVMRPRFGCGASEYVFAPNEPATRAGIAQQIRDALSRWEPRIELADVRVEAPTENLLLIQVDYRVAANNQFYNLVYPFYITEGGGN
jgi:phage baseplate assembly protein W